MSSSSHNRLLLAAGLLLSVLALMALGGTLGAEVPEGQNAAVFLPLAADER